MAWISMVFGIGKGIFQAYRIWFIVVPLVAVLGAGYLYYRQAESNKEKLAVALLQKAQAEDAARTNSASLELCRDINAANALEAATARERAIRAEARVKALNAITDDQVKDISHESDTFRTELTCDALTDDFKRWVRDS